MTLSISTKTKKLIDERLKSGRYKTADDVVAAAVSQLAQQEQTGDFEPGELDRLLEEGEKSGTPLDGEKVLAELEQMGKRASKRKRA
jgi:putative addiction module CopG family antidote